MQKSYNILLTTMRLDIGGAETHIVELAKGLRSEGHNPVVASTGGVFEKELAEHGIKSYYVPLDNKKPQSVVKSFRLLKKIIIDEKIDLVHAHARIPGFICGILHRRMGFPFVTTAHGTWKTTYGLKYITNWGQKTVAVSEDIKKYLLDNYKINENDIKVTINGIDTDKFSPEIDTKELYDEFKLHDGAKKLVYVSRLDEDRRYIVSQLLAAIPSLIKEIDDLKIFIVGGGNILQYVTEEAAKLNAAAGAVKVIVTGPRIDTNKFTALADVFIGFGRSSLEAMAAGSPLILAGNQGYIGIFEESKLRPAVNSNFSCRGESKVDTGTFAGDILKVLRMSPEERRKLGAYGRQFVEERYSVKKMVQDNLEVYSKLLESKSRTVSPTAGKAKAYDVLISGYYGFDNSGDDAILMAIVNNLKTNKEDIKIAVLSKNPTETSKIYGVDSVDRFNLFKVVSAMKKSKLFINGGGNLIQDISSTRSLMYYLSTILIAKAIGLKVMLYANGIGPVNKGFNRRLVSRVVNKVDVITLREEASKLELDVLGITRPEIVITADPALSLEPAPEDVIDEIFRAEGIDGTSPLVGFSIRKWTNYDKYSQIVAQVADYLIEKYSAVPVFLPMHFPADLAISRDIASKMKGKPYIINNKYDIYKTLGIVKRLEMMVGMRLHALIYATNLAVPVIGLIYDPKVEGFLQYVSQPSAGDVSRLDLESFKAVVDRVWTDRASIKSQLSAANPELRDKALSNAEIAIKLLG